MRARPGGQTLPRLGRRLEDATRAGHCNRLFVRDSVGSNSAAFTGIVILGTEAAPETWKSGGQRTERNIPLHGVRFLRGVALTSLGVLAQKWRQKLLMKVHSMAVADGEGRISACFQGAALAGLSILGPEAA